MKKQLLILSMALIGLLNQANAQGCGTPLTPLAGKKYTYSVTINPAPVAGDTFDWYVTTDKNILTPSTVAPATGDIIAAGTDYHSTANGKASIDIVWTSKAVNQAVAGTKFYLVIKYTSSCTNNLKPWIIVPFNIFQIDVENVNVAGTSTPNVAICRSAVAGATIDGSDKVTYDYGVDSLFIKVTAKNFTDKWTPKIDMGVLTGSLDSKQKVTSIEWSTTTTFNGTNPFDLTTGLPSNPVPVKALDNITDGNNEFVYIKIKIAHKNFEGLADQTIKINVSATDSANNPDKDVDTANNCAPLAENDNMTQVIKARPSVTEGSGIGSFLPAN